jgi:ATP-dependent Lhr-like helicase
VAAIPPILEGRDVLLVAPTGSGKTEAALLPLLTRLLEAPRGGIRLLYITPLRALNRDMVGRLEVWARRLGLKVSVRHGDTPQRDRRRLALQPPDILVTTPESLQALLPGRVMRRHLRGVRWVVVDEVHELVESKRGVQLAVGLARLRHLVQERIQVVGLSATVGDPKQVARFLAGEGCLVLQVGLEKQAEYFVEYPYPGEEDVELAPTLYTSPEAAARLSRLSELVDQHRSTLIFVNSRTNAELVASRLGLLRSDIRVHHGSLPREERERVEAEFKEGRARALICTSTLELGIDIGAVDFVAQYMSPRQVVSLIQRVGRSGHRLEQVSRGLVLASSSEDALEAAAVARLAAEGRLEETLIPENCLDVLAHQLVGLALDEQEIGLEEAYRLVRGTYPYRNLSREAFDRVAAFLIRLGYLWREDGRVSPTRRGRRYYFENLSTIPDERLYPVIDLSTQQAVGILGDEFMATEARVGVTFICKGRVWRIKEIGEDGRVYVLPAEDPLAAIPGWDGELIPLSREVAQEVGRMRSELAALVAERGVRGAVEATRDWPLERYARQRVAEEVAEHLAMGAPVPTDRRVLVEAVGQYLVVHTHLGELANRTLGHIFDRVLAREGLVRFWWADGYRVLLELTTRVEDLDLEGLAARLLHLEPAEAERAFLEEVEAEFPYAYYLKFVAERFGAIERGRALSEAVMQDLVERFRDTPIYEEALREGLERRADLAGVRALLQGIATGRVEVALYRARGRATPLAYHSLNRHLEVPELVAPETAIHDSLERMKLALEREWVRLLCFECGHLTDAARLKQLEDRPRCPYCHSPLQAPATWSGPYLKALLERKLAKEPLEEEEARSLARAKQAADLVAIYGKRAVMALAVYGVGPQTAAKILARMHDSEEELLRDLLEAKLKFVTTRPYWG